MRAILFALVLALCVVAPLTVVGDAAARGEARDATASARGGTAFQWPPEAEVADPALVAAALADAVKETNVGVSRMTVETTGAGRTRLTYYVYLGRERSSLLSAFTLRDGRWLTAAESFGDRVAVSSRSAPGVSAVGAPSVLGDRYDLEIAPLRRAFDHLPAAGTYVIDSQDAAVVQRFLAAVTARLAPIGGSRLTVAPSATQEAGRTPAGRFVGLWFVPYAVVPMIAGLGLAVLTREAKRVGVLRMNGHSVLRVWLVVLGRMEVSAAVAGVALSAAIVLVVPGADVALILALAASLTGILLTALVVSGLFGAVMIVRLPVVDLVKGALR